jgi:hypothetical protein
MRGTKAIAIGYSSSSAKIYYSADSGGTWTSTSSSISGNFNTIAMNSSYAIAIGA